MLFPMLTFWIGVEETSLNCGLHYRLALELGVSLFRSNTSRFTFKAASRKALGHPPIVSVRTSNLGQA